MCESRAGLDLAMPDVYVFLIWATVSLSSFFIFYLFCLFYLDLVFDFHFVGLLFEKHRTSPFIVSNGNIPWFIIDTTYHWSRRIENYYFFPSIPFDSFLFIFKIFSFEVFCYCYFHGGNCCCYCFVDSLLRCVLIVIFVVMIIYVSVIC